MAFDPEKRVQDMHLILPEPAKPVAKYRTALKVGNMLYVSGHGLPADAPKELRSGCLGKDLNLDQGYRAAREVGRNILGTVKAALGSLNKVKRLVKTLGMVASTADFGDHPKVINGFSELMAEVFGEEAGIGTRSAVGMSALPAHLPVEIECIFEVEE